MRKENTRIKPKLEFNVMSWNGAGDGPRTDTASNLGLLPENTDMTLSPEAETMLLKRFGRNQDIRD